jgi:hypothetical protein
MQNGHLLAVIMGGRRFYLLCVVVLVRGVFANAGAGCPSHPRRDTSRL